MKHHARARIGIIALLVALIAASFPAPASAIISVLSVSPGADRVPRGAIKDQSHLLQAATPTETPTNTPAPASTNTPAPAVQSGSVRPQIGVKSYQTNPSDVQFGKEFRLIVKLRNEGQASAFNVQASFTSSDFLPLKTGGVVIVGDLAVCRREGANIGF